jgi:CHC2 zinc finger
MAATTRSTVVNVIEAKHRLALPELMRSFWLEEQAKKSARCPFHDDKHNSFSVYQSEDGSWHWKCFAGCGGGDEVDFLAKLRQLSVSEACQEYIELAGGRIVDRAPVACNFLPKPAKRIAPIPPMPKEVSAAWCEGVDYLWGQPRLIEGLASSVTGLFRSPGT